MCRIGGATFSATRNSPTSLLCEINSNDVSVRVLPLPKFPSILQLMLSASAGTSEVADVSIVWVGQGVNHQIDNIGSPTGKLRRASVCCCYCLLLLLLFVLCL